MLKTMQAKYPGRCSRTGQRIQRGQTIIYNTETRTATLPAETGGKREQWNEEDYPSLGLTESLEGFPRRINGSADYVSHVFQFGDGREYYRNKNGRCEDAPCCGCCTI
jgi:hypothetical protein